MQISEELTRLQNLHQLGALSELEYVRAKARLLDGSVTRPSDVLTSLNQLRRKRNDRWIAGVCGGIAAATGMEPWLARLLFAILLLFGGTGGLIYLLFWLFIPNESTSERSDQRDDRKAPV